VLSSHVHMVLCLTEFDVTCSFIAPLSNAFRFETRYAKKAYNTVMKIKVEREKNAKICRKRKEDRNVVKPVELVFIRYWIWF
jgi:hypothetical protein